MQAPLNPPVLIDLFGRKIDYIRLSITDRCDFRCVYCMSENMQFLPRNEVLSLEDYLKIAKAFVALGVKKIRVTGGEPLVRKNALWLFKELGKLPGLNELVLTTNGSQLEHYATALRKSGVRRVNISLDSLNAESFRKITRVGDLNKVLRGIQAAQKAGFEKIKLNALLMKGVNDMEAPALVAFAIDQGLDIAFIEEMPLGQIDRERALNYVSNDETLQRLNNHYVMIRSTESTGGPSNYWRIPHTQTKVGFISPNSHNFCESCNRVRISCEGQMYLCLGQEHSVNLKPYLTTQNFDAEALKQATIDGIKIKPKGHDFDIKRASASVIRFMSRTGG